MIINKYHHASGTILHTVHYSASSSVSCHVVIPVGSINDPTELPGLAHCVEHLLIRSLLKNQDHKHYLDREGVKVEGWTDRDYTHVWFQAPSAAWKLVLELALQSFDDFPSQLHLGTWLEIEKKVIHQELLQKRHSVHHQLWSAWHQRVFSKQNYQRPVLGSIDALKKITVSEVNNYWHKFYSIKKVQFFWWVVYQTNNA